MRFRICKIGASEVDPDTLMPLVQVVSEHNQQSEQSFSKVPVYGAIGLTSLPYPATESGWCEVFVGHDVAGYDVMCVGFRDPRIASIYGSLVPGDTAVHSTGPKLSVKTLWKEEQRQWVTIVTDEDGVDHVMSIDATTGQFNLSAFGGLFSFVKTELGTQVAIANENGSFGLLPNGRFFANTPGGTLGSAAMAPAQGIAYGVTGPVNLISSSWAVAG